MPQADPDYGECGDGGGGAGDHERTAAAGPSHEAVLPVPVFLAFLRRLHEGPPQHAAAVRVAVAIWQAAVDRGDMTQASEAVAMVRAAVDGLITSMTALQDTGRRWSGVPSPTMDDLATAEQMAAAWEARHRLHDRSDGDGEGKGDGTPIPGRLPA